MRSKSTYSWLLIALAFVGMWLLNSAMPVYRDDYNYSVIWLTNQHLEHFADLYPSLLTHYLEHGGRMFSFAVLQGFIILGKEYFNVANALIYTLTMLLLYWHAVGRVTLRLRTYLVAFILAAAWLCYPRFGEVVVWMCGSTVYLWTTFAALLFLLPYRLHYAAPERLPNSALLTVVMIPLGFLAGMSMENTAVATGALAFAALYRAKRNGTLRHWQISGFCSGVVGAILLIAAPGNWVRLHEQHDGILRRIGNQFTGNGEMLLYIIPLVLALILIYRVLTRERGVASPQRGRGLYIAGALALVLAISYAAGGVIGDLIGQGLYYGIVVPIGKEGPLILRHITNAAGYIEEYSLYILLAYAVYKLTARRLAFGPAPGVPFRTSIRRLAAKYPQVQFCLIAFAGAAINNISMLAAPNFPARATFFAANLLIIGTASLCTIDEIQEAFYPLRRYLATWIVIILVPFYCGTLYYTHAIALIDAERIAAIRATRAAGNRVITFDPIPYHQRFLRHITYIDWHNPISRGGIITYFDLDDIYVRGLREPKQ